MTRIVVIGDRLEDRYVHGKRHECQDGCWKFVEESVVEVPGGAANAARSLEHADCEVVTFYGAVSQTKVRYMEGDLYVFRTEQGNVRNEPYSSCLRSEMIRWFNKNDCDAVYIADYAKGFLTNQLIAEVIKICNDRKVPVVVDPKRNPHVCWNATLKCNEEFFKRHEGLNVLPFNGIVVTRGSHTPLVGANGMPIDKILDGNPVICRNHIGAGDAFGAWMTFGLVQGLDLVEAACYGHAAGKVYVQHPHNRPPWPHDIKKQLDPVLGKVVPLECLEDLRQSVPGRIVVAPGVFRIPHAGHAAMLSWARQQGDALVVALNSDESAACIRPGQFCLPLKDRLQMLCSLQCVDFIAVFDDNTPVRLMKELQGDLQVKGPDHAEEDIPGSDICKTLIAPANCFSIHASDLIEAIRR